MLIKYSPKYEHIKCVPLVAINAEQRALKLVRSQVQLLPGTNEVTDDEWTVMKSHLTREIAAGEISVIEKETKKGAKAHDLKSIEAKDATELVANCVNPDTLKKWYQEETRQEIRLAIVEKMKELKVDIPKYAPGASETSTTESGSEGEKALEDMNKEELLEYAKEKGLTVSGKKEEILEAIKAAEKK
jgi:hypothetical protein